MDVIDKFSTEPVVSTINPMYEVLKTKISIEIRPGSGIHYFAETSNLFFSHRFIPKTCSKAKNTGLYNIHASQQLNLGQVAM